MFRNLFKKIFSQSSVGLEIRDDSIRFIELIKKNNSVYVNKYGEVILPLNTMQNGEIINEKNLEKVLSDLKKDFSFSKIHLSVQNHKQEKLFLDIFKNSKIKILSLEHKIQSIFRSLVLNRDEGTYMIVEANKNNSHLFIISDNTLMYKSDISDGPEFLQNEISKHFIYWHTNQDVNFTRPNIQKIILVGDEVSLQELAQYLSVMLRNTVELGNVWTNVLDTKKSVPVISFDKSFIFTNAVGVALKGLY